MDPTEDQPLPPPAPFMFGCDECVRLLTAFGEKISADAGCFYEQLAIARHIAEEHPDDVPAPHTQNCAVCPNYAANVDDRAGGTWAEHRARDLFLPEAVARLM
jgi:hypothetical protein